VLKSVFKEEKGGVTLQVCSCVMMNHFWHPGWPCLAGGAAAILARARIMKLEEFTELREGGGSVAGASMGEAKRGVSAGQQVVMAAIPQQLSMLLVA
jgi:hypothetical protein